MLTELLGKGGQVCQHAKSGEIKCPLIVRPTSEDVLTGEIFQVLGAINPRWWLPQILNAALGTSRFRKQVYRRFRIELWKNRTPYPRELLPWNEGSTQVDVTVTWENPPTTVFCEMKYGSDLSSKTAGDDGTHGFPSDQLIRNIRVGLLECSWFRSRELFEAQPRRLVVMVIAPTTGHSLVEKYRDEANLRDAIPHAAKLIGLPATPFVGEISYAHISRVLSEQRRWMNRTERMIADQLIDYLAYKRQLRNEGLGGSVRQSDLALT